MNVNKLWTLIYNNQENRVSTFELVSSSTRIQVSTKFSKSYIGTQSDLTQTMIHREKTLSSTSKLNETHGKFLDVDCELW